LLLAFGAVHEDTWVAIPAINAAVQSTSQVSRELQPWDFVKALVHNILGELLNPGA